MLANRENPSVGVLQASRDRQGALELVAAEYLPERVMSVFESHEL